MEREKEGQRRRGSVYLRMLVPMGSSSDESESDDISSSSAEFVLRQLNNPHSSLRSRILADGGPFAQGPRTIREYLLRKFNKDVVASLMSRLVPDKELAKKKAVAEKTLGRPLSALEAFAEQEEEVEREAEAAANSSTGRKRKSPAAESSIMEEPGQNVPVSLDDPKRWKEHVVEQLLASGGEWAGAASRLEWKRWDKAEQLFNEALAQRPRGARIRKTSSLAKRAWHGESVPHVRRISLAAHEAKAGKQTKPSKRRRRNTTKQHKQ
jgi:hypothetical protein